MQRFKSFVATITFLFCALSVSLFDHQNNIHAVVSAFMSPMQKNYYDSSHYMNSIFTKSSSICTTTTTTSVQQQRNNHQQQRRRRLFELRTADTVLCAVPARRREGSEVLHNSRPTTCLPKRKAKNNKKKKFANQGMPLTDHEIAQHVSSVYLNGPGGILRKQQEQQNELGGRATLVLNADYQPMSHLPLSLWHWQEAIKAVFSGKCTVVDVYPDIMIRTVNFEIPFPSVIALNDYVPKQYKQIPAFTKRNVFLRDEYKCQYCNKFFRTRDLSLDHVKPRSMGGILCWENTVTSCLKCNGRKGCLPVEDLRTIGMKLLRQPYVPTTYQLEINAGKLLPRKVHPTWEPYLGISSKSKNGHQEYTEGQCDSYGDGENSSSNNQSPARTFGNSGTNRSSQNEQSAKKNKRIDKVKTRSSTVV